METESNIFKSISTKDSTFIFTGKKEDFQSQIELLEKRLNTDPHFIKKVTLEINFFDETLLARLHDALKKASLDYFELRVPFTDRNGYTLGKIFSLIAKDLKIKKVKIGLPSSLKYSINKDEAETQEEKKAVVKTLSSIEGLEVLDLSYTYINQFLLELFPLCKKGSSLKELNLHMSHINVETLKSFCSALKDGQCSLEFLKITSANGPFDIKELTELSATNLSLIINMDDYGDKAKNVYNSVQRFNQEHEQLKTISKKLDWLTFAIDILQKREKLLNIEIDYKKVAPALLLGLEEVVAEKSSDYIEALLQDYIDEVANMKDPKEAISLFQQIMKPNNDIVTKMLFNHDKKSAFILRQIYTEDERSHWTLYNATEPLYLNDPIPDVIKNKSAFVGVKEGISKLIPNKTVPSGFIQQVVKTMIEKKISTLQEEIKQQKTMEQELKQLREEMKKLQKQDPSQSSSIQPK